MTDYYVRTGGGNSNGGSTTYSLTTGGPADGANPTATDNVFLDANSGQLTVNASFTCANFNCTGYTGTLSGSSSMVITGATFKLVAGMTYSHTGGITFTGANAGGPVSMDFAGKTMNSVTYNGPGIAFNFLSALIIDPAAGTFALTAGNVDVNGFDLSARILSSSNSNVRSLDLGGSTLTLATQLTIAITTNLTWVSPASLILPIGASPASAMVNAPFTRKWRRTWRHVWASRIGYK
jgi:hypothetical protein